MDTKTLLIFSMLVNFLTATALVIYHSSHKTYPGFKQWILATYLTGLAYVFFVSRVFLPTYVSIVSSNILFTISVIYRFDAITSFLENKRISKKYYFTPYILVMVQLFFYFVHDSVSIRTIIFSGFIAIYSMLAAIRIMGNLPFEKRTVYYFIAHLFVVFFIVNVGRMMFWMFTPLGHVFEFSVVQTLFFLMVVMIENIACIAFMMLQSQRLERELVTADQDLRRYIAQLEMEKSKVKKLSGLLPICSSCKKIRDDAGYWQQLEIFFRDRSDVDFSHGICPDCVEKLYPGLLSKNPEHIAD